MTERRRRAAIAAALLVAAAIGCDSGAGDAILDMFPPAPTPTLGTATVTGTFGGETIVVASAVSTRVDLSGGDRVGAILLADEPDFCGVLTDGYIPFGVRFIQFELFQGGGPLLEPPEETGTYTVVPLDGDDSIPKGASLLYSRVNASECSLAKQVDVDSGTVELVAVDVGTFAGSFEAVTESGEPIEGAFNPVLCPAVGDFYDPGLPCL